MQGAVPLAPVSPAAINCLADHAAVNWQSAMGWGRLFIVQSFFAHDDATSIAGADVMINGGRSSK